MVISKLFTICIERDWTEHLIYCSYLHGRERFVSSVGQFTFILKIRAWLMDCGTFKIVFRVWGSRDWVQYQVSPLSNWLLQVTYFRRLSFSICQLSMIDKKKKCFDINRFRVIQGGFVVFRFEYQMTGHFPFLLFGKTHPFAKQNISFSLLPEYLC